VLDEAAVADQVFQAADEHQLEEHDRIERGLPRVAVERPSLLLEKVPVQQLRQPAVKITLWHALRQLEAEDNFVEELLMALHSPKVP
jgi:hypothetical protein